jgi:hypothetical protein
MGELMHQLIDRERAADCAANEPAPLRRYQIIIGPPTLKLGQINERLAPLSISAEGLARLGFPAAAKERSACLYHDADFPRMVDAAIAHLRAAQQERRAA